MSAAPTSYRSDLPAGHAGFAGLLRAELTKLRTVRGWVIALALAGLLIVLMAVLATFHQQTSVQAAPGSPAVAAHPFVPLGPGGEAVTDSFYFVHQPVAGNGSITVRLSSLTGVIAQVYNHGSASQSQQLAATRPGLAPWAKAGLIVKESTRQG
ncbi:MAG TPA: hypothetical protein VFD50_05480, partial [Thermoleophilia bacterium]|nr:hypothetical protein [Thermoleophilia bacterium]